MPMSIRKPTPGPISRTFMPPMQVISWDSKNPEWPGAYISFWSLKIHEALANYIKAASNYELSPLAQRVSNAPDCEVNLIAWLREQWSGPHAFLQKMLGKPPPHPAQLSWGSDLTGAIARTAAGVYLEQMCHSLHSPGGQPGEYKYDSTRGECVKDLGAYAKSREHSDSTLTFKP